MHWSMIRLRRGIAVRFLLHAQCGWTGLGAATCAKARWAAAAEERAKAKVRP
jgi:hypothetical protein